MSLDKGFVGGEKKESLPKKYKKISQTKPIKIYAYDQKLKKERIVQLDDFLNFINVGEFKDENTSFYYCKAYEKVIDVMKRWPKGIRPFI